MRKLIVIISLLVFSLSIFAQDIHYSQYYANPLNLNPALTGFITDGHYRATAGIRSQWNNIGEKASFQTLAFSYDMQLMRCKLGNNILGGGINLIRDRAGDTDFSTTQMDLSLAYHQNLGRSYLGLGVQAGLANRSLDITKLTFNNQFDGRSYDAGLATGEDLSFDNFSYFDLSAGVLWAMNVNETTSLYAGGSYYHINQPSVSFYRDLEDLLYERFTINLGGSYKINRNNYISPSLLYYNQGPHNQIIIGAFWRHEFTYSRGSENQFSFHGGLWYRYRDAITPAIRFYIGDLKNATMSIGISWDFNVSKLKPASKVTGGGPEITLALIGAGGKKCKAKKRLANCPIFQ